MRRTTVKHILEHAQDGQNVTVTGWVRNKRVSKNVGFLEINDGSAFASIQAVFPQDGLGPDAAAPVDKGASVRVEGALRPSQGKGQDWELLATAVQVIGDCPDDFPIQSKRTSMEFLREKAHLRPRTRTFGSVFRVRNALSMAIHEWFQARGYLWIHTPIISVSDAEGAGEMFQLTDLQGGKDFFGKDAFLAVSGQLNVEAYVQAFCDVYTFGPTFRAENSHTGRHASEFWMIEPEIAFADLDDLLDMAESFVRDVAFSVQDRCPDDMDFFNKWIDKGVADRVRATLEKPFERMTYTKAIEVLQASGKTFEHPTEWGVSLQTEHERYLAEDYVKGPVFVTDYPTDQKAFYMRLSDDGRTVAATDLLVPRLGEIIGGSQREERLDVLTAEIERRGMETAPYWWYLELRRYGSTPHAGFGLGFERMLMYLTGMGNIRDVLPFPRTPGQADF